MKSPTEKNKEYLQKDIEFKKKEISWLERNIEITKKLREEQLKNYVPTDPQWEFEKSKEYQKWALEKQKLENEKEAYFNKQSLDKMKSTLVELELENEGVRND